jgi:hypothetical protein
MASQGGQVAGWFWPDIRPVFGRIYALFLAKIYAQKAFLENTAFSTGRIFLGVYYRAYMLMDSRSALGLLAVDPRLRVHQQGLRAALHPLQR